MPVLRDVSSALTYLHSHRTPIIHRDVSSGNVILQAFRGECDWLAKLSDFGSASVHNYVWPRYYERCMIKVVVVVCVWCGGGDLLD